MKPFTIILPIAIAFLLIACQPTKTDQAVTTMLTDMYNNELYQDYEWLEQHCTDKCLQYLRVEYEAEYICESEDCYAVWMFRTNNQDGYTNEHRMVSVDNIGNGYYEYTFIDMGFQGINRVKIIQQNDSFYIDEIQQIAEEGF